MIANYGYEDGTGAYYIKIDTSKCCDCDEIGCVKNCPADIFELEEDDFDNVVAVVKEQVRNTIKTVCASCKPLDNRPDLLPCQDACGKQAIVHSW